MTDRRCPHNVPVDDECTACMIDVKLLDKLDEKYMMTIYKVWKRAKDDSLLEDHK